MRINVGHTTPIWKMGGKYKSTKKLKTKEQLAIEFIQKYEPEDEPYMLCYSGGKDSVVLEDLVRKSGVKYIVYYSLTPDPPELLKFIKSRKFKVNILRPNFTFWRGIEINFPPHRKGRWCCNYIKEKPSTKIPLVHRLLGIRAEESRNRAKQGMINERTKKRINYHPLFDWLEWEIWDYIETNNLEYCSLYDEGFSRLGCVVCPMRSYKDQMRYKDRWPQYFKLFEKSCKRWWDKKGCQRQKERGYTQSFEEFLDNWYKGI